jgi:SAM-dependent methyltransferase
VAAPGPGAPPAAGPGSFDAQAARYDARAGLPPTAGAAVARAIVDRAGLGAGDLVVELGAGTGEIGVHLARLPVRYLGLDASSAMLAEFRVKAVASAPTLVVADGNARWPLPDGAAAVVFASRAVHLLDPGHVAAETRRVCGRGGYLVLGRVLREPDGLKERLRRRRLDLLVDAGLAPRQGEAGTRRVVALCEAAGAASLGRQVVAEWTGAATPAAIIAGWEGQTRMGSVAIDPATRARVLDAIRAWAQLALGDLDRPEAFRERYAIDIVRLP